MMRVVLVIVGFSSLFSLCLYVWLIHSDESDLLFRINRIRAPLTLSEKLFAILAAAGLFICVHQGVAALMFWLPQRELIVTTVAFFLWGGLVLAIGDAHRNKVSLQLALEYAENIESIIAWHTPITFSFLKNKLIEFEDKTIRQEENETSSEKDEWSISFARSLDRRQVIKLLKRQVELMEHREQTD